MSGVREVWLVDAAPIMGGAEVFALKLARYAADSRPHRVVRLVCPPNSELATRAMLAAIDIEPARFPDLSPRSPLAIAGAVISIRRLLAAAGPDVIVVANDARAHAYVSVAAALVRHPPPVVLVAHEQESAARPTARFVYRRFGALVAIGANTADTYERAVPDVEVLRINNFLLGTGEDDPLPAPGHRPPAIGVVARMIPEKGVLELVNELASTPEAWSKLRVAAALQDSAYVDEVRQRVDAHGLSERIELLGEVSDVPGFLATIDVLVASAVGHEGQPTAILEALGCGRPVVVRSPLWSSDFEGLPVVPYRDARDLGDALDTALRQTVPPWSDLAERFGPQQALDGIEAAAKSTRS